MVMAMLLLVLGGLPSVIYSQADPCTTYSKIRNVNRSIMNPLNFKDDVAISDARLKPGWYRVTSLAGEKMPTKPPGTFQCGTMYPIWLNGSLPNMTDVETSEKVCVQTLSSECEHYWKIDIKKCSTFLVYNLKSSVINKAAYCFGAAVKCPDGEYSETGYSPGCTANVPLDTFSPVVKAELIKGKVLREKFGPRLEEVFRCSFTKRPTTSYVFDVHWYINDDNIVSHVRLSFIDIESSLLLPTDWVGRYQMNMIVSCAVRARYNSSLSPGPTFLSPLFEAGVKPEKAAYSVKEGEVLQINLISTVPVGCVGSNHNIRHSCSQTIKIFQPVYQKGRTACTSKIEAHSLAFESQHCGVTIFHRTWQDPISLIVTGYVDKIYNTKDRTGHLRLGVNQTRLSDNTGVWDNVKIPDIQVAVLDVDASLSHRICKAWNDPLYQTFDGHYFNHTYAGEYILYRHKKYPYWVHTLTTRCSRGSCNCGIAIRSYDSLFVTRTCDVISSSPEFYVAGRAFPHYSYKHCDNRNMLIQKTNDGYEVTLPSGLVIKFHVKNAEINVITLQPSVLDINQTEGLCGYTSKSKDGRNDFIPRGSTLPTNDKTKFVRSWRIVKDSVESLFTNTSTLPSEDHHLRGYCLCADEAAQDMPLSEYKEVHCNLTAPTLQCMDTKTPLADLLKQECTKNTKRDVDDSDDVFADTPLTYDPSFEPDETQPDPVWRNGWNATSAKQACTEGLYNEPAVSLCEKYAFIDVKFYITSCVEDIKIAGGTEFLKNTIVLIEDECDFEVSRNETLFTNSSSESEESVFEELQNNLCQPTCTANGYCSKKNCICNDGFIGNDCSYKRLMLPGNYLFLIMAYAGRNLERVERPTFTDNFGLTIYFAD